MILLDRVLEEMTPEKQITYITSTLQDERVWGWGEEDAVPLVEALEQLFEQGPALRACLMQLCNAIPMQIKGDDHHNEQLEVAAGLRLTMLTRIIEG